tara:strand:+ start:2995 stop:3360 length:366 start_codon:yes stop_codon:yes gene_type:complete
MKFTLTRAHLYWWPVKVAIPHPDKDKAGEQLEMTFKMQFEALPREDAERIAEDMKRDPETAANADIRRVARDWDEVVDAEGKAIPFSTEALDELMQISWYRMAVYRAWGASLIGDAARLGN